MKQGLIIGAVFTALMFSSAAAQASDGLMSSGFYNANFYAGLGSGIYTTKSRGTFSTTNFFNPNSSERDGDTGLMTGAYLGYGGDFNNGFYLGTELGVDYQPRPSRGITDTVLSAPYLFHWDIIPGFVGPDHWLFFGRLGLERTDYHLDRYFMSGQPVLATPDQATGSGWRLGLGVERAIASNISLQAGITHIQMSKVSFDQKIVSGGAAAGLSTVQPSYNVANLGITYRFGDGAVVGSPSLGDPGGNFFNGPYAGAQVGVYYLGHRDDVTIQGVSNLAHELQGHSTGLIVGPYAGLGQVFDSDFYLGGEVGVTAQGRPDEAQIFNAAGQRAGIALWAADRQYYADLMPGYVMENGMLLYTRLGVQLAQYQLDVFSPTGSEQRASTSDKGFRLGVGLDDPLSQSFSLRAGLNFIDMMKMSVSLPTGNNSAKPYMIVGNVGISYHFNG